MATYALSRDTKLFVAPSGGNKVIEIPVLSGYSFSQNTATQEISVQEAGATPVRGQRSYNTALNPAEVSFSTYIRPYVSDVTSLTASMTAIYSVSQPTTSVFNLSTGTVTAATNTSGSLWNLTVTFTETSDPDIADVYADMNSVLASLAVTKIILQVTTASSTPYKAFTIAVPDVASVNTISLSGTTLTINLVGIDLGTNTVAIGSLVSLLTLARTNTVVPHCIEEPMWLALLSGREAYEAAAADTAVALDSISQGNPLKFLASDASQAHELMTLDLYFVLLGSKTIYTLKNTVINSASVDFGLDAISTIAWSGQCSALTSYTSTSSVLKTMVQEAVANNLGVASNTITVYNLPSADIADANLVQYIKNKLTYTTFTYEIPVSTFTTSGSDTLVTIKNNTTATQAIIPNTATVVCKSSTSGATRTFSGTHSNGTVTVTGTVIPDAYRNSMAYVKSNTFQIPITGGNIEINNNITYLTPENLGELNLPIGHFTGARSASGTITAYLKTGNGGTKQLYDAMVADLDNITPSGFLTIQLGGLQSTYPESQMVTFTLPKAKLSVPEVNIDDVLSISISFVGESVTGIEGTGEVRVDYKKAKTSDTAEAVTMVAM